MRIDCRMTFVITYFLAMRNSIEYIIFSTRVQFFRVGTSKLTRVLSPNSFLNYTIVFPRTTAYSCNCILRTYLKTFSRYFRMLYVDCRYLRHNVAYFPACPVVRTVANSRHSWYENNVEHTKQKCEFVIRKQIEIDMRCWSWKITYSCRNP